MPELPEVETVVRWLNRSVANAAIKKVEVLYPKILRSPSPRAFIRGLQGAKISSIGRRGKYILVHLSNENTLLVHLRMTGQFLYVENSRPLNKQTSVVFYLEKERKLVFEDWRRFGVMKLVKTVRLPDTEELSVLAPEPFGPEFTAEYLFDVLQKTSKTIKETLLDQTKISGTGNIYASEALFVAGINPQTRANQLSKPRARKLHDGIIQVLKTAIKAGDKINVVGREASDTYFEGVGEDRFFVYGRAGQRCRRCGVPIERIVQGGRSTFYCPRDQRR